MRWFGLMVVAAGTAAVVYFARAELFKTSAASPSAPAASKRVARPPAKRIFAGGTVEGTQRDIPLHFEIAGRLKEIHVEEGDHVEQGDVLAQLDPEVWELKLAESQARLKLSRAERDRLVNGASQESREVLRSEVR